MNNYAWYKSKTVWGTLLLAAARVVADRSPQSWAENIGLAMAVVGGRDAVAKNGNGQ